MVIFMFCLAYIYVSKLKITIVCTKIINMDKFNLRYVKPAGFISACVLVALLLFFSNKYISQHWEFHYQFLPLQQLYLGLLIVIYGI